MHLGFEHRVEQRHELSQRLTHAQRLEVGHRLVEIQWELAQELAGEQYSARGQCPGCEHRLTAREILAGFSRSPTDTTTRCPKCKMRFQSLLIAFGRGSSIEVNFYCPSQTLAALDGMEDMTPSELSRTLPGVYQSALVHYGSLGNAFAESGKLRGVEIIYAHADLRGWEAKVGPFLGQLPDKMIAKIVRKPTRVITTMRIAAGINPFRSSDLV